MATILLADSSSFRRLSIRHRLRSSGHTISEACGLQQAFEIMQDESHDCLIVEQLRPFSSASQLLGELRARGSSIPVIVVSETPQDNIDESMDRSCCCIAPPISEQDLENALSYLLIE